MLRQLGRRSQQRACGWQAAHWAAASSFSGGGSGPTASWVLVQREGDRSTTAVGGGGAGEVQLQRRYHQEGDAPGMAAASSLSLARLRQVAVSQLQATFLPTGYPHTVAPRYLCNTLWAAAHHTCGSVNGVLASTFLLYSVGLGAGAVPTAGALNWVLKDGLGQMGTLLFGKAIAHNFDVSSRAWYLLASAKLNLAMGLEICTFLLPHYFLPIGALANGIKGLSWMAGGSTKSVFKVSFAADNNFGDVSAKATSQTICASIMGTSIGVLLASQVGQSVGLALACYTGLAAAHMWTGYKAVRCVPLATLNPSRLELLVQCFLQQHRQGQRCSGQQQGEACDGAAAPCLQWVAEGPPQQQQDEQQQQQQQHGAGAAAGSSPGVVLPTPAQLAPADPVFHVPWLHIGTPLRKLVQKHGVQLGEVLQQARAEGSSPQQQQLAGGSQQGSGQQGDPPAQLHLLVPDGRGGMHLLLHEQAESADCILGFLHAFLVCHGSAGAMGNGCSAAASGGGGEGASTGGVSSGGLAESLAEARRLLPGLLAALEAAGWDDAKVVLEPKRRRVTW